MKKRLKASLPTPSEPAGPAP